LTEISSIAKCAKLQELDVSYNALTSTALKDLKALGRLDVLNLEGNALTDLDSMPRMEELTELNVARNALRRLPDTFAGKCPELQILDLGECALEGDVGTVASALAGLAGLTELTLRFNPCAWRGRIGRDAGETRCNPRARAAAEQADARGSQLARPSHQDRVGNDRVRVRCTPAGAAEGS
jgi:Leucine-rich repeat (LRR) protein